MVEGNGKIVCIQGQAFLCAWTTEVFHLLIP